MLISLANEELQGYERDGSQVRVLKKQIHGLWSGFKSLDRSCKDPLVFRKEEGCRRFGSGSHVWHRWWIRVSRFRSACLFLSVYHRYRSGFDPRMSISRVDPSVLLMGLVATSSRRMHKS